MSAQAKKRWLPWPVRPKRLQAEAAESSLQEMALLRGHDAGDPRRAALAAELAQLAEELESVRPHLVDAEEFALSDWAGQRAAQVRLLLGFDAKARVRAPRPGWQTKLAPGVKRGGSR